MRTLRDFQCDKCDHVVEKLVEVGIKSTVCPKCGHTAHEQMGMPTVRLEGITGSFPGAADKWARIREDNARIKAARS